MKVHHHKYAIILISAAAVVVFPVLSCMWYELSSQKTPALRRYWEGFVID